MENVLHKYDTIRRELTTVQNSLIMGRVNDARIRLSNVLMQWPSS